MSNLPLPPGFDRPARAEDPQLPDPAPEPETKPQGLCVGSARFCTEIAPLLNMQVGEAPSGEDWLYLYNYKDSPKPVPIILKYLWQPFSDAVKMAFDPRFTMMLSLKDIRELQLHRESKNWLFFWLEWSAVGDVGVQFGIWYTTVAEFNQFLDQRQVRVLQDQYLFDVRNFKQFRWQMDTRGTYFSKQPAQPDEPEGKFPTRESVYEGVPKDENKKSYES
jgi:hypothetical protein